MKSAGDVMNTIPSIFNERQINHTMVGGKLNKSSGAIPVTCVVLIRNGSQYRTRVFENIMKCNFAEVISVEQNNSSTSVDSLARLFPDVKFIVALEKITPGDMMNMAADEAENKHLLVLYDDLCIEEINFNMQLYKKLTASESYCVVPRLFSSALQALPVNFIPGANHSVFTVSSSISANDKAPTLYPFDFTGFYDRDCFKRLGGADYTITSPYWQNLDLSFRAWLWGEQITINPGFQLTYGTDVPGENRTADLSYLRFYLKNLLPVYVTDHAHIPLSSFFAFKTRSACGMTEAIRQFSNARKWTEANKYRFKTDAASLIENWAN